MPPPVDPAAAARPPAVAVACSGRRLQWPSPPAAASSCRASAVPCWRDANSPLPSASSLPTAVLTARGCSAAGVASVEHHSHGGDTPAPPPSTDVYLAHPTGSGCAGVDCLSADPLQRWRVLLPPGAPPRADLAGWTLSIQVCACGRAGGRRTAAA